LLSPEGKTECGVDIRFTEKGDILYAHLLERPKQREIAVRSLAISSNAKIQLLGAKNDLEWRNTGKGVSITLPAKFDAAAVYVIKIMN
jgi:alpha-L-fucosidase